MVRSLIPPPEVTVQVIKLSRLAAQPCASRARTFSSLSFSRVCRNERSICSIRSFTPGSIYAPLRRPGAADAGATEPEDSDAIDTTTIDTQCYQCTTIDTHRYRHPRAPRRREVRRDPPARPGSRLHPGGLDQLHTVAAAHQRAAAGRLRAGAQVAEERALLPV